MSGRALITVVVTTYFPDGLIGVSRQKSATAALKSWGKHLRYDGPLAYVVVNSSGPVERSRMRSLAAALQSPIETLSHIGGVGGSLNRGFRHAFDHGSPITLYAADDWALDADFDITPWADLLVGEESVGMVRLGPPHPDLTGRVRLFPAGWALQLDRHHFAFGHRPAIYHQRFLDAYGWFDEGGSAWEVERIYNEHFARTPGPEIVYALPYPWRHVGETEVGDLEPLR